MPEPPSGAGGEPIAFPPIPRREARHLLPFASVVLTAELLPLLDGQQASDQQYRGAAVALQANVWDISRSGACLCFSEVPPRDVQGLVFRLNLHQPTTSKTRHCRCRVIWTHRMHGVSFAGVELLEPLDLGAPFFRDLIQPGVLQEPAEKP